MKAFGFVAFNLSGKKKLDTVKTWSLSEAKREIQQRELYLASIRIKLWSKPFLIFLKSQKNFSFLGKRLGYS